MRKIRSFPAFVRKNERKRGGERASGKPVAWRSPCHSYNFLRYFETRVSFRKETNKRGEARAAKGPMERDMYVLRKLNPQREKMCGHFTFTCRVIPARPGKQPRRRSTLTENRRNVNSPRARARARARGNERRGALLSDETVAIIRRLRPDVCPGDGETGMRVYVYVCAPICVYVYIRS